MTRGILAARRGSIASEAITAVEFLASSIGSSAVMTGTLQNNVRQGDLIVLFAKFNGSSGTSGVSDSQGNTWTKTTSGGSGPSIDMWTATAKGSMSMTDVIAVRYTGTVGNNQSWVASVLPLLASNTLDRSATPHSGSGFTNTLALGSTTRVIPEVAVTGVGLGGNPVGNITMVPSAGWTLVPDPIQLSRSAMAYQILTTLQNPSVTWTSNFSSSGSEVMMATYE